MNNEQRIEITGRVDQAGLLVEALERLVDGDGPAMGVLTSLRELLTGVANDLEPGESVEDYVAAQTA